MCPSPPSPTTPTFCPLPTFQCRSGEYVVIPAQSSGAVPARFASFRSFSTNASSTTMRSEYPPYVTPPEFLSWPLHVNVGNFSQYCSSPRLHGSHCRHESTIHPTAAKSPSLNFFTFAPTL